MSDRSGPRPPDRSEPEVTIRLLRLGKGCQAVIRTLSEHYRGCMTHWSKGRSRYCPGAELCDLHRLDAVWKGYCCCEQWVDAAHVWEPWVLEITESLDQDFFGRFHKGQVWQLTRAKVLKEGKAAPVSGKLWEERDPTTFPPPFDMRPVLQAVYHVAEVRLDLDNPLPRRLVVPSSRAAPPRDPARNPEPTAAAPPTGARRIIANLAETMARRANGEPANGPPH